MDERQWIRQILAGDMQSFSCLVAKYEKRAYTLAFRILENREEAEEVMQDAFVRMYRALPLFQFESKFSTWFYRIVYRTALTAHRRQRLFIGYDEAGDDTLTDHEIGSATALLEQKDRKEIIREVLGRLSADESLLLTLYYLEECTVDDIHQITGLTPSNIKVKLFRSRKRFYETLQRTMQTTKMDIL